MDEAIDCAESPNYYRLNSNFGDTEDATTSSPQIEDKPVPEVPQTLGLRKVIKHTPRLNE